MTKSSGGYECPYCDREPLDDAGGLRLHITRSHPLQAKVIHGYKSKLPNTAKCPSCKLYHTELLDSTDDWELAQIKKGYSWKCRKCREVFV